LALPDDGRRAAARTAASAFGLRVPRHYLQQINPGDINDPLLRQIMPLSAETTDPAGEVDAVGDRDASLGNGVLHKYHGRVLLVTTGACAVHCRYCFRRHFDYAEDHSGGSNEARALKAISSDETIKEVILSGGDPLSLSNARLKRLVHQIQAIEHVETLRLHSRTPVVEPSRLDDALLEILAASSLRVVLVIHANHPRELSPQVLKRMRAAATSNITLLNQSVLLNGVNDKVETLKWLSERLFEAHVLPYYLHLLDPVPGTLHFEVNTRTATQLIEALAVQLPGYLVPKLAKETAGAQTKFTYANYVR